MDLYYFTNGCIKKSIHFQVVIKALNTVKCVIFNNANKIYVLNNNQDNKTLKNLNKRDNM